MFVFSNVGITLNGIWHSDRPTFPYSCTKHCTINQNWQTSPSIYFVLLRWGQGNLITVSIVFSGRLMISAYTAPLPSLSQLFTSTSQQTSNVSMAGGPSTCVGSSIQTHTQCAWGLLGFQWWIQMGFEVFSRTPPPRGSNYNSINSMKRYKFGLVFPQGTLLAKILDPLQSLVKV